MAEHESATITWTDVVSHLTVARSYWLNTVNADFSPHAAPVWGIAYEDDFYFYTSRETIKARNLARDPRVIVHLESAENVLIVHGRAKDCGEPRSSPDVVASLDAKYDDPGDAEYLPSNNEAFDVLFRIAPSKALTWVLNDYDASQRRWREGFS